MRRINVKEKGPLVGPARVDSISPEAEPRPPVFSHHPSPFATPIGGHKRSVWRHVSSSLDRSGVRITHEHPKHNQ
ncbi:hypothetical protein CHU98_g4140 [Xylaria longipes]|nr:hypothetical protein CHU98_g4140 [Xylaria longipes]